MPIYVALLRGINVGKSRRISMADLRALVEHLGGTGVKTYVNSGNIVFGHEETSAATLETAIADAINERIGQAVPVVIRTGDELATIVEKNPFPDAVSDPKTLHVTFLAKKPDAKAVKALADAEKGPDDYRVVGRDVYLFYPNKLTGAVFMPNGLDAALGMVTTSRNWRTVTTLAEMANG
ncbi:MAG TPA: DUF1697 domain-containing protein [Thermomicrobiales bacterium]|nr:DUF1697 domain-containing protein [Thermomicrobiales bacterium]